MNRCLRLSAAARGSQKRIEGPYSLVYCHLCQCICEDLKRELKEVNATPGPSPSNLNKEDLKRELKAQTFFVLPLGRIWL